MSTRNPYPSEIRVGDTVGLQEDDGSWTEGQVIEMQRALTRRDNVCLVEWRDGERTNVYASRLTLAPKEEQA